jgi:uncharacterized protein YqeY
MSAPVLDRLMADIKDALKGGDKEKVTALRMLHSEIKNLELIHRKEITDESIADVTAKAIKQRLDAAAQYRAAGRIDLAEKDEREIVLFRAYQPAQLGRAEVEALARECVQAAGATTKKDMGRVMALLMPKVKGKADGKLVNEVVGALLP